MKLSKKQITLALITSLLVILSVMAFYLYNKKNTKTDGQQETSNVNVVNYDPPTDEEKDAGDAKKTEIVNNTEGNGAGTAENTTSPSTQTANATIVIVDANQYDQSVEIRAFVSNIVKNGTCTYILKNGNTTITRDEPAYADASTTPCINLTLARSDIPTAGTWSVEVKYSSDGYYGSATTTMEIQ